MNLLLLLLLLLGIDGGMSSDQKLSVKGMKIAKDSKNGSDTETQLTLETSYRSSHQVYGTMSENNNKNSQSNQQQSKQQISMDTFLTKKSPSSLSGTETIEQSNMNEDCENLISSNSANLHEPIRIDSFSRYESKSSPFENPNSIPNPIQNSNQNLDMTSNISSNPNHNPITTTSHYFKSTTNSNPPQTKSISQSYAPPTLTPSPMLISKPPSPSPLQQQQAVQKTSSNGELSPNTKARIESNRLKAMERRNQILAQKLPQPFQPHENYHPPISQSLPSSSHQGNNNTLDNNHQQLFLPPPPPLTPTPSIIPTTGHIFNTGNGNPLFITQEAINQVSNKIFLPSTPSTTPYSTSSSSTLSNLPSTSIPTPSSNTNSNPISKKIRSID